MSTSFCYGCLYATRKEIQGVGLTWDAMWEETSPGDSMSLGLVFVMIVFDGCLYAVIGYLIARYTNSGRSLPTLHLEQELFKHCKIDLSTRLVEVSRPVEFCFSLHLCSLFFFFFFYLRAFKDSIHTIIRSRIINHADNCPKPPRDVLLSRCR